MSSASVPKRQLGRALQALREAAGKTREQAAEVLECSPSKISRIENGRVGVRASELRDFLDLYAVPSEQRTDWEALARETRHRRPRTTYRKAAPVWFRRYLDLEETAYEIRKYDVELITGLLQTEAYTRAVTAASPLHVASDVDRLVKVRAARQGRLASDDPPLLWTIMSEAALRLQVGGPAVMREQLGHILDLAKLPHVTVQVTPFVNGAHAATGFSFTLLRFADDVGVDVVYLEDLTSASYLDKAEDAQRQQYALVWQHLSAGALSPAESSKLVDTVRREL